VIISYFLNQKPSRKQEFSNSQILTAEVPGFQLYSTPHQKSIPKKRQKRYRKLLATESGRISIQTRTHQQSANAPTSRIRAHTGSTHRGAHSTRAQEFSNPKVGYQKRNNSVHEILSYLDLASLRFTLAPSNLQIGHSGLSIMDTI